MPKDNKDFFKKKQNWSEIKDSLLGWYIKPYFQKLLATNKPILYVDCFAGKGKFDDGKPGSPMIALDARKDSLMHTKTANGSIEAYFIELNHAKDLEVNLESYQEYGFKPHIVSGKYEEKIEDILAGGRNRNVFLYIDPYGIKALDTSLFDKFSSYSFSSFEMLINFNSFGFIREACRALKVDYGQDEALNDLDDLIEYEPTRVDSNQKSIELLNRIADGIYWQDIVKDIQSGVIDGYEAEKRLSTLYKRQLKKRYKYVLDMPIQIKKTNHPKYRMVHVCNHEEGCLLMAENMLKRKDELVVNIQQSGQITLFDFLRDVNTTVTGEQITSDVVKAKMKEHLMSYSNDVRIKILIADFYTEYGLIGYQSMVNEALKELEMEGFLEIERCPSVSSVTGKPLTYMTEGKNQKVIIRRSKQ